MDRVNVENVLEIVNETIKGFNITKEQIEDNLAEKGMDSIEFIHLVVALEEAFGCVIPDEKLLFSEMNTIKKIIETLQEL